MHIERKKMTFFEICLDEISYNTPYLQVLTEKKSVCKYFFLREISSAAPIDSDCSSGNNGAGGGGGGGGSGGGGSGEGDERTFKFTRNMGAYCSTHGHHPVVANHTSATCTNKREGHNDLATADHRFSGSNFWPGLSKVKSSQQDHVSYKGKSANN